MTKLLTTTLKNFRGVDFANDDVELFRSPDALNVWKNYNNIGDEIETRPDIELQDTFENHIYGLFFYKNVNTLREYIVVHVGASLISIYNNVKTVIKQGGMNPIKSESFYFGNKIYIKDGLNYLEFDGTTCQDVVGYIPTTGIFEPNGKVIKKLQDVNFLSTYRVNEFVADGTSTLYKVDNTQISNVSVKIDNIIIASSEYTVDLVEGEVIFNTAPTKAIDGVSNVMIEFSSGTDESDRIKKCNILKQFDNRVFFTGNINYPNTVFHSSLNDPTYCSDLDFYDEGGDLSSVKALVSGNRALFAIKEPSQANTNVFYHTPLTDSTYGKVYPNSHSNISTGCVATGINFKDDIVFFSDKGMEAITGSIEGEQLLQHRSSLVDNKMVAEANYKDLQLVEWEGYLLVIIDYKIYLANSRDRFQNNIDIEYEWFYWEFANNITYATEKDGILYLCIDNKIYTLTSNNDINSYWTTAKLRFNAPAYNKITSKRGFIIDAEGDFQLSIKKDTENFENISNYTELTSYIVNSVKIKKFRDIQLKLNSSTSFKLYNMTISAYIGAYLKK